ncbi:MAG: TonB family protein [Gammaproteobacteria bacterium]|nr:TonB family protein [Gammaproteobacteria bacterium]
MYCPANMETMDIAASRSPHRRFALALCAATAVHVALLALPLSGRPQPRIGLAPLQVQLSRAATEPATRTPAPPAKKPATPSKREMTAPRSTVMNAAAPAAAVVPNPPPATTDVLAKAPNAHADHQDAMVTARGELDLALARHFRYPLLARRQGWQGEVLLSVPVAADGSLGPTTVLRSSGHAVLDRAALAALARVPALSWTPGIAFTLELPVRYRLHKG